MNDSPQSPEARRVEGYLDTVERLEPDISCVDRDAALTSIAVSLKRIADSIEPFSQITAPILAKLKEEGLL
jgi:hypothetical protein